MSITRRLAAVAVPVVLAGSLSSCGMLGGGPPTDASEDEFCDAYNGATEDLIEDAVGGGGEPEPAEIYDALQSQVSDLEETGTPEDVSDDEREGFEIYVDEVGAVDEDEFVEAYEDGDEDGVRDISDEDEEKVDAFTSYGQDTCGNPAEEQLDELEDQLDQ